jgi:hypothetical protein
MYFLIYYEVIIFINSYLLNIIVMIFTNSLHTVLLPEKMGFAILELPWNITGPAKLFFAQTLST